MWASQSLISVHSNKNIGPEIPMATILLEGMCWNYKNVNQQGLEKKTPVQLHE